MNKNKSNFIKMILATVGIIAFLIVGLSSFSVNPARIFSEIMRNNNYSLTLDSSNKVTSNGDKVQKTKIGNNVTFSYAGVASSTSGHVTLNNNGTIINKDWIRSITTLRCEFSGNLTAKLSYGGDVWNPGFTLTSGEEYDLGSNPYYIQFISSGTTTINSIVFGYSCLVNPNAHEDSQGSGESHYEKITDTSDLSDGKYLIVYEDGDLVFDGSRSTLDAVSNYQNVSISDNYTIDDNDYYFTIASVSGGYSIKSKSDYYIGQSTDSNGLSATSSSQTNTITFESNGDVNIIGSGGAHLRYNSASNQNRFRYYKTSSYAGQKAIQLYKYVEGGPSYEVPEKDFIGFSISDSKANNYKMSDVFDTANGLDVRAHYTDGSSEAISKGGENGYSYVVKDSNNNTIDSSQPFNNLNDATFTVIVSYKSYIPQQYQISVQFVDIITGISVDSDTLIFNTAQKLSDYTSGISANLTYNKEELNKKVSYVDFNSEKLTLTLLDPSSVSYAITNVFGTAGTWKIKVSSNDNPSVYGLLEITVNAIQVTSISVTGSSATLEEEAQLQLTASVTPNNATDQTVTWTSNNTSVATVNTNGLVTGVSAGNVRITATANDGSAVYGYIDLTVTSKPVQSEYDAEMIAGSNSMDCTVDGSSGVKVGTSKVAGSMTIQVGAGATKLSFYAAGWNGTSTVVALSAEGISLGTTSFSLTADSGISGSGSSYTLTGNESEYYKEVTLSGVTSDTTITVSASTRFALWKAKYYTVPVTPIYPTSISLSGDNDIAIGETSQLSVDFVPDIANVKNVTYSSNKTNIATVNNTGLVTGVAAGTARITATAETASGTTTAYIDITVSVVAVTGVTLNKSEASLEVGNTEQLTATIAPANAGNKDVTWTSSNTNVATVSNGLVTAVAVGTATITVKTNDGNKTDTCAVTVSASSGGSGSSGTTTIEVDDIPTTYSTSSNNTTVDGNTYTIYNVANSYTKGAMQWKKSSGYIENTTAIEGLTTITIGSVSGKSFSGTLYSGSTASPSSNSQSVTSGNTYNFSGNPSYFKLSVGSSTGYTGDITLTYSSQPIDPTAISISPSSVELAPGGTRDLNVTYTPSNANNNTDITWSRYSGSSNISVNSSGKVSVSTNASAGNSAVIRATLKSDSTIYASCTVTVVEQAQDDQTILIYLCGSDLESNGQTNASSAAGYASGDITEILKVSGQPDDVNVVIETGGAKCWKTTHGINKNYLERYHVANKQLVRDSQETKANMGLTSTLQSFITWGVQTYPADRISLILWNHGGAMRGVCYDENYSSDSLTNSEVKTAVKNSFTALGRSTSDKFEWIGYDACLMQVQDIAEFNSEYFNYMVASEESEAGAGWDYDNWLDDAYAKKSTPDILKAIVDSFIAEQGSSSDQTLSYLDLSYMAAYKSAWETMSSTINSMISSYGKSKFQTLMKTAQYYGTDEYSEGYSYFGIFDAKDVLNKIKATSAFSGAMTQINNALTAFANLVAFSRAGSKAGNSYGLCCFFPMKDGSGYTCETSSVYTSSQTNFTNWRSIVTSYGD